MSKNDLTIAEVVAFTERVKAALESAESDRLTVEALRALVRGDASAKGPRRASAGRVGRANDGKILEFVRGAKGGARVGDMIKSLRMNRKALSRALQRLRQSGSIKMVGVKRLARYHAS